MRIKALISVILIVSLFSVFSSCSDMEKSGEGSTTTESTVTEIATTENLYEDRFRGKAWEESTVENSAPEPSPVKKSGGAYKSIYGKNTGTDKTYTGLEPLEKVTLPIVDPENLRGLSDTAHLHSFGVSSGGVPHEISVENQKLYEKYNGRCLDTSGENKIYLTFDCGYENGCTADILDTLKEKKVKAAFFVTLPIVKSNPELIARMINEGHIVGNHSDTHPNFSTITRTEMVEEIQTLDNYLREHFGYSSPFFRFPEGACSEKALELVDSIGYCSVFWSSAYADWDVKNPKGKQYAFDTVTSRLHNGCILLLHAVSQDNADALGDIIDFARNNGYRFSEL